MNNLKLNHLNFSSTQPPKKGATKERPFINRPSSYVSSYDVSIVAGIRMETRMDQLGPVACPKIMAGFIAPHVSQFLVTKMFGSETCVRYRETSLGKHCSFGHGYLCISAKCFGINFFSKNSCRFLELSIIR